jgi:hypothetical protein
MMESVSTAGSSHKFFLSKDNVGKRITHSLTAKLSKIKTKSHHFKLVPTMITK